MNNIFSRISRNLFIQLVLAGTIFSSAIADDWIVPQQLIGTWSARQQVTVRMKDANDDYLFIKDTVTIAITINDNRTVEGTCGGAAFQGCMLAENRGWFGRFFNLATDYIITGKLVGKIFEKDTLTEKTISAPFNVTGTTTAGSLFQKESWFGIYPMADFGLEKK
ncbi:MAG: hypothetical protein Q8L88_04485 [Bacteroidota bacterium]|nr:hypothetical protein [Bacteroidota bacterium]